MSPITCSLTFGRHSSSGWAVVAVAGSQSRVAPAVDTVPCPAGQPEFAAKSWGGGWRQKSRESAQPSAPSTTAGPAGLLLLLLGSVALGRRRRRRQVKCLARQVP